MGKLEKIGLLVSLLPLVTFAGPTVQVNEALQKAQTLEELIPQLPAEMRSNFTFVYKSRSPHGGLGDESKSAVDKLHPRIILFSADGKETLAFTGNPDKPGFGIVERIRFVDGESRFEFSRYVLPEAVAKEAGAAELAKENGKPNPAACLRCHGEDPRPISDSYPLWPGFYGSVRDTFPKDSPEGPWYRKFLKKQKNAGVYRHLDWPKGTSVPPYLDPKQFDSNAAEEGVTTLKFLPNTRLGMAWTELNRKRIQRKLKASPAYAKLRYSLLSGFLGCRYLPLGQEDLASTEKKLAAENEDRLVRLGFRPKGPGAGPLDMAELGFNDNATQVAYLADALGIGMDDWSLAFEKDSLSFFDGILSGIHEDKDFYLKEDFMLEMLRDLAADDPDLRPYFKTYRAYEVEGYPFSERLDYGFALAACRVLPAKERALGADLPAPRPERRPGVAKEPSASHLLAKLGISGVPFQRCTACHEGAAALQISRKIPFSSPGKLREALAQKAASGKPLFDDIVDRIGKDGEGQMPPHGARLAEEDTKGLRRYLEALLPST